MPAIKIGKGVRGVRIENVAIKGFDVGIEASGAEFSVNNADFQDVSQAFDVSDSQAQIANTRIARAPKSKTGWRKINGPPLPVFCPNCKGVFASRHYNFGGAYFNLLGNEEPCPNCGYEHAVLSEGVFNLTSEVVHVLSAPDMTYVMLQSLNAVAADVIAGRIEIGTAIERIETISPSLGEVAKKSLSISARVAGWLLGPGIAIIAAFYSVEAVKLAEAQLEIAQEQLDLQKKQDSNQHDAILEEILKHLPRGHPSVEVDSQDNAGAGKGTSPKPTESEAAAKGDRLKARDLRRNADKQRRNEFGRARHR